MHHADVLTKHVERPTQVNTDIMQHRAEPGGEGSKENNSKMAGSDYVLVRSIAFEVFSVNVKTEN